MGISEEKKTVEDGKTGGNDGRRGSINAALVVVSIVRRKTYATIQEKSFTCWQNNSKPTTNV